MSSFHALLSMSCLNLVWRRKRLRGLHVDIARWCGLCRDQNYSEVFYNVATLEQWLKWSLLVVISHVKLWSIFSLSLGSRNPWLLTLIKLLCFDLLKFPFCDRNGNQSVPWAYSRFSAVSDDLNTKAFFNWNDSGSKLSQYLFPGLEEKVLQFRYPGYRRHDANGGKNDTLPYPATHTHIIHTWHNLSPSPPAPPPLPVTPPPSPALPFPFPARALYPLQEGYLNTAYQRSNKMSTGVS